MDRLQKLAVNSEGFVFDPTTGDSFTANSTGLFILNRLREGKSADEIAEELKKDFENAPEEVSKDVSDFVTHLHTYNLM
ncbi:MAG: PqqD family protein [Melioribacteraceae bacterium]|nr:PqqD family protein [Melioribacteraceae bacterium]MCF8411909.1 PqqD family protein [Melioribacteraceae bacterium]